MTTWGQISGGLLLRRSQAQAFLSVGEARLRAAVGDTLAEMFKRKADVNGKQENDPMNDFSKAMTAFDEALETLAKNAQRDDETMEQAYDRLLSTDPNFQTLVKGRNDAQDLMTAAHRHEAGETATKAHAEVQKADQELDALAKTYAAKNGVTFEQAYDTIIQQPEGASLYAKYVEAQNRLI